MLNRGYLVPLPPNEVSGLIVLQDDDILPKEVLPLVGDGLVIGSAPASSLSKAAAGCNLDLKFLSVGKNGHKNGISSLHAIIRRDSSAAVRSARRPVLRPTRSLMRSIATGRRSRVRSSNSRKRPRLHRPMHARDSGMRWRRFSEAVSAPRSGCMNMAPDSPSAVGGSCSCAA